MIDITIKINENCSASFKVMNDATVFEARETILHALQTAGYTENSINEILVPLCLK
jgi:hypothetical protein